MTIGNALRPKQIPVLGIQREVCGTCGRQLPILVRKLLDKYCQQLQVTFILLYIYQDWIQVDWVSGFQKSPKCKARKAK